MYTISIATSSRSDSSAPISQTTVTPSAYPAFAGQAGWGQEREHANSHRYWYGSSGAAALALRATYSRIIQLTTHTHLPHTKDQLFLSVCPLPVDSRSPPISTSLSLCDYFQQLPGPHFGQSGTRLAFRCLRSW